MLHLYETHGKIVGVPAQTADELRALGCPNTGLSKLSFVLGDKKDEIRSVQCSLFYDAHHLEAGKGPVNVFSLLQQKLPV